jgi:hypothetical protein
VAEPLPFAVQGILFEIKGFLFEAEGSLFEMKGFPFAASLFPFEKSCRKKGALAVPHGTASTLSSGRRDRFSVKYNSARVLFTY